ncbi:MAG: hypothetical protein WAT09_15475 [Paracoccaceae bacterium]
MYAPSISASYSKVAQVTAVFWVLKIIATTLGEMSGDYLAQTLNLGYWAGLGITSVLLIGIVGAQWRMTEFHTARFWAAIVATTTVGTEISDLMDRTLGLGYTGGSVILFAGLVITLLIWQRREGNLSIYPITHKPAELLFWTAVLFSNSLGTAFGDFLVDVIGLSYMQGAMVTMGVIGVVMALHRFTTVSHVTLFWVAFVFTRPFGATFGDFLTKPMVKGGLDLGTLQASAVALVLMAIIVTLTHRQHTSRVALRVRNK